MCIYMCLCRYKWMRLIFFVIKIVGELIRKVVICTLYEIILF